MISILYIFTVLPAWFVGPLQVLPATPNGTPIYYSGPSVVLPLQPTADGTDRVIVIVDPPAPATVAYPIPLKTGYQEP